MVVSIAVDFAGGGPCQFSGVPHGGFSGGCLSEGLTVPFSGWTPCV